MTTHLPPSLQCPISTEKLTLLQQTVSDLDPRQIAWLSGYLWGLTQPLNPPTLEKIPSTGLTVLSASQTGNARRVAEQLREALQAAGHSVNLVSASEYRLKQLAQERCLLVVISTQGEGDPPEEAQALHRFLFSKKAPRLENTQFAVLGLGDSSYDYFCQAGKVWDEQLAALGATRILPRCDADVDFQPVAEAWRQQLLAQLPVSSEIPVAQATTSLATEGRSSALYHRDHPYAAELLVSQKLTGRGSDRDIRHLELDLSGSGLSYQPGDALGVWYENDPHLIEEILSYVGLSAQETVTVNGESLSLFQALSQHFELTQNTPKLVQQYAELTAHFELLCHCEQRESLLAYVRSTPLVDMFRQYPTPLQTDQLLALLRPLSPRLYSISSAQDEVGEEVHITVGVVQYEIEGKPRFGGASGYLAQQVTPEQTVRVFIEPNPHFRLPEQSDTPIIMIGPGTGIAPFRAFIQQREARGAQGKNWLFFGNPHFTQDFLYQVEWQRYVKSGLLTQVDLAWSRDQAEKVYVQDRLREKAATLWQWLEDGAHIYVCGDAGRMAKDVEQALLEVISEQGNLDMEQAEEYLNTLRTTKRYQRDVY